MKKSILFVAILMANLSFSQDLITKISNKAEYIFTINTPKCLEQVSAGELAKSRLFKEAIKEFFRGHEDVQKMEEFGVDLNERIYVVSEIGEDIHMTYVTYHIADLTLFESYVKSTRYEITQIKEGELNKIAYDYNSALYWNDDYAWLVNSYYTGREFDEWGWGYYNEYEYTETVEYAEAVVEEPNVAEMTEEEYQEYLEQQERERERKRKEDEEKRKKKEQERAEKRAKKEAFVAEQLSNRAKVFFSDDLKNNGESVNIQFDNQANASFWYPNYVSWMSPLMYGYGYPYYRPFYMSGIFGLSNMFSGELMVNGYMRDDELAIEADMEYFGRLKSSYNNVMDAKLNKKMLSLISEQDMGFATVSLNTEAVVQEYPTILAELAAMRDTNLLEEYQLMADLFSVAVDEEALSELFTGNMGYIFHGLGEKEVEYYSYDYDENYNYTKTLKTKMEVIPDMTLISGTERSDIAQRFVDLGLKHNVIQKVKGGYLFTEKTREFPVPLYFGLTDDWMCITSNQNFIVQFETGKVNQAISGDRKKNALKNNFSGYLNFKELFSAILKIDDVRKKDRRMFELLYTELSTLTASVSKTSDGMHMNMRAPVPDTEENGGKYLLEMIDQLIEIVD